MKPPANATAVRSVTSLFGNKESDVDHIASEKGEKKPETGIRRSARLQVILPEPSVERLEKLKETTEAASYSEVIRISLRLYEGLLDAVENGSKITIERPDGSKEHVLFCN